MARASGLGWPGPARVRLGGAGLPRQLDGRCGRPTAARHMLAAPGASRKRPTRFVIPAGSARIDLPAQPRIVPGARSRRGAWSHPRYPWAVGTMPRHREPVLPVAFVAPAGLRAAGQVTSGPHRSPGQFPGGRVLELRARFHGDLPADLLLQEMRVATRIVFASLTRCILCGSANDDSAANDALRVGRYR